MCTLVHAVESMRSEKCLTVTLSRGKFFKLLTQTVDKSAFSLIDDRCQLGEVLLETLVASAVETEASCVRVIGEVAGTQQFVMSAWCI